MKLKALFILIALLIAISHTALAGSMESNLAGSWIGADGSLATYAKVKGDDFSGVLTVVNFPYSELSGYGSVTKITTFHGVLDVEEARTATFTYYGQALDQDGMSLVTLRLTGVKTLVDDNNLETTELLVCDPAENCFPLPDNTLSRIQNLSE